MTLPPVLSDRQRAVAVLVAAGLSNRAIAETLGVGRRTVDTHVRHILRKLGVRSRVQIGVWVSTRAAPRPAAGKRNRPDPLTRRGG
jgi:DNA-binding NarL/FixJ family response regulator